MQIQQKQDAEALQNDFVCQHKATKLCMPAFLIISFYFVLSVSLYCTIISNNGITSQCGARKAAGAALNVSAPVRWVTGFLRLFTMSFKVFHGGRILQASLNLLIIRVNATLIYWSLSRVIQNFQKAHWIMSVISISGLCWSFTLVPGQSQIIGFLNLRLSALPDRFGEIKIFPVQWINIKTSLPLTLKMC